MSNFFFNCWPHTFPPNRSLYPCTPPDVILVEMGYQVRRRCRRKGRKRMRGDTYFIFSPELKISVREVAAIALDTLHVLGKVLAKGGLVQVIQLLPAWLRLLLHDRNWNKLSQGLLSMCRRIVVRHKVLSRLLSLL